MKSGKFFKMHGTGNSFILIFCGNHKIEEHAKGEMDSIQLLAKNLCHPNFSIGADGLLAIYPPDTHKFKDG